MLFLQLLAAVSLTVTVKCIPLYSEDESLDLKQTELGQFHLEQSDFEQYDPARIDLGAIVDGPDRSSNLYTLNGDGTTEPESTFYTNVGDGPIDLGSTVDGTDGSSNLYALNGDGTTEPESNFYTIFGDGFPDLGQSLTEPSPDFTLLVAASLSCPKGGSIFCCPDYLDVNCIPGESYSMALPSGCQPASQL